MPINNEPLRRPRHEVSLSTVLGGIYAVLIVQVISTLVIVLAVVLAR